MKPLLIGILEVNIEKHNIDFSIKIDKLEKLLRDPVRKS